MVSSRKVTESRFLGRGLWTDRRRLFGLLAVSAFLLVACTTGGATAVTDGAEGPADAAPDFELVLFENNNHGRGEKLRLSQFREKPVVINFWFPSCPPCRVEMPDFEKAFQRYNGNGVEFIGVQSLGADTIEDGQRFVDEFGINYAVGPDEDNSILLDYKVRGFPTTVFVDKDQRIRRTWTGLLDAATLDGLVQDLLN